MKIREAFVQAGEEEYDRECLNRRLFPVNMRLYTENARYKTMIAGLIDYMNWALDTTFEDYGRLTGVSAANLGLAFNIVIVVTSGVRKVMLNPEIIEYSDETISGQTNNPSLNLKEKISVKRAAWVTYRYYNMEGKLVIEEKVHRNNGGFNVQHEVDSNNGIMPTTRATADGVVIGSV